MKREAAKKEAEAKKAAGGGGKGKGVAPPPEQENDGCIIDNLLKEIRAGTTLKSTGKRGSTIRRKPTTLSNSDLGKLNSMVTRATTSPLRKTSLTSKSPTPGPIELPADVSTSTAADNVPPPEGGPKVATPSPLPPVIESTPPTPPQQRPQTGDVTIPPSSPQTGWTTPPQEVTTPSTAPPQEVITPPAAPPQEVAAPSQEVATPPVAPLHVANTATDVSATLSSGPARDDKAVLRHNLATTSPDIETVSPATPDLPQTHNTASHPAGDHTSSMVNHTPSTDDTVSPEESIKEYTISENRHAGANGVGTQPTDSLTSGSIEMPSVPVCVHVCV